MRKRGEVGDAHSSLPPTPVCLPTHHILSPPLLQTPLRSQQASGHTLPNAALALGANEKRSHPRAQEVEQKRLDRMKLCAWPLFPQNWQCSTVRSRWADPVRRHTQTRSGSRLRKTYQIINQSISYLTHNLDPARIFLVF